MKKRNYLLAVLILLLVSCVSPRTSVLESYTYREEADRTDYAIIPLGAVSIQGKWSKTHYNTVSNQQFFVNRDSIEIAIAFNRYDQYEFNPSGAKKEMDFVKAFYEWDSKYLVDAYGLEREILEENETDKYMIYRIYGRTATQNMDTYFLIGEKNGNVCNASVSITDKWTAAQKQEFLKKLFIPG